MPLLLPPGTGGGSGPDNPGRPDGLVPQIERRLELALPDGSETFPFDGVSAFWLDGAEGLYCPPCEVALTDAGRGQLPQIDVISDLPAESYLPMLLEGATRADLEALLVRLRRFLQHRTVDYRSLDGTYDLVAVEAGSVRRRRCAYKGGLEGNAPGGEDWMAPGLTALSVWPWWRGEEWTTPLVKVPDTRPFVSDDNAYGFGSLYLVPDEALGEDMPVTVRGTVPSPAVIELWGPSTSTVITSPAGLSLTVSALATDDHLLIDGGRERRMQLNGGDRYSGWSKIARGGQMPPFPPGETTVSIVITGATAATAAQVRGTALYESPWPEKVA